MRKYELTYIIHPDSSGDKRSGVMAQVETWVKAEGGKVIKTSDWGRRQMAYAIRDQHEGHYIHLEVELPEAAITELERNIKLSEVILRHLLVRADD